MSDIFLDDASLDHLTGIRRGSTRAGVKQTKYEMQAAFLREIGIPFISNARGRPVVLLSAVESRRTAEAPKKGWKPAMIGA
ncbi:DUF4224 domain-containing protein [Herbaspirillum rubrisubalbicans]|uniref:DUF4224 domain-containing protein n=1 Tax=Herbaspirillum rubrisubalbicans TaxID=80842 RepID=A0ABX9C5Z6_9BURK|nr:DUF4224 domain-containing protein [Herbaspirillum rubrisubalbicans]RAM65962.1 hypothetical protein RB24_05175 [Herbaspirillum rubrisubalbicans]